MGAAPRPYGDARRARRRRRIVLGLRPRRCRHGHGRHAGGGDDDGHGADALTPAHLGLMVVMWAVMMVAMMLPSAAPVILLFTTIERRRQRVAPYRATTSFVLGYLTVWTGFSLAAAVLQWVLERLALLSPMMATASVAFAGAVLVGAGLYELTPLKRVCLRHCRSPLDLITHHWRQGPFRTGLGHGLFCLGCCWMLMTLLFVGGVMNPLWIAIITLFVVVEKSAPFGDRIGRTAGVGLALWGSWTLLGAVM